MQSGGVDANFGLSAAIRGEPVEEAAKVKTGACPTRWSLRVRLRVGNLEATRLFMDSYFLVAMITLTAIQQLPYAWISACKF